MFGLNYHIKNFILPMHLIGIAFLLFVFFGIFEFNLIAFLIGWSLIYGAGLVTGFHKALSHKAFPIHDWAKKVYTLLGCLGISGSPIWWVATHRGYHHADTEGDKDLQTPRKGIWSAYLGWQFGEETSKVKLTYAREMLKDPFMLWCHKYYAYIVWIPVIALTTIDISLGCSLLVLPMLAAHHGENITNLFGHLRCMGYRNFNTNDDTINNPLLAFLTWGQLLHNNHHAKPNRKNFSEKWWEIDPTIPFVWLAEKR